MAKIYRCDRCGKESKYARDVAEITVPKVNYIRYRSGHVFDSDPDNEVCIELCPSCVELLHVAMRPPVTEEPLEVVHAALPKTDGDIQF